MSWELGARSWELQNNDPLEASALEGRELLPSSQLLAPKKKGAPGPNCMAAIPEP